MNTLKHYVNDRTEVATIIEVLSDVDAANRLGYKNDNYSGTAVYAYLNTKALSLTPAGIVGSSRFYERSTLVMLVEAYIKRATLSPKERQELAKLERAKAKAKENVIKTVTKLDPEKALFIQELIKQALATTK
jgi:hypothetical protein